MTVDFSKKVDNMTPHEILEHQEKAWDPDKTPDPLFKQVCNSIRTWRLARYRKYLKKVEANQGNITEGFPLD